MTWALFAIANELEASLPSVFWVVVESIYSFMMQFSACFVSGSAAALGTAVNKAELSLLTCRVRGGRGVLCGAGAWAVRAACPGEELSKPGKVGVGSMYTGLRQECGWRGQGPGGLRG